ncbi:GNAT family N-acetyltransferase [Kitasatospora sp. NPDC056327]|uniref:GNAT family N-acetyltransferase n=1 Tax=Kitasatospora sp. NPDC056327 TaxID=3345785 RepID=UPI0035DE3B39
MVPVRLTGPRLAIREFHQTPEDADALHAVFGDPEATRFLPFEPRDRETCADQIALFLEEAEKEEREVYRLAVTRLADADDPARAVPIGSAALGLAPNRAASLGYALRRDVWGLGYAGEVVGLLCGLAFGTLGLHRLEARTDVGNTASVRVLTRAGFRLEGRVRHDFPRHDGWRDAYQYALLADDVRPGAGPGSAAGPAVRGRAVQGGITPPRSGGEPDVGRLAFLTGFRGRKDPSDEPEPRPTRGTESRP